MSLLHTASLRPSRNGYRRTVQRHARWITVYQMLHRTGSHYYWLGVILLAYLLYPGHRSTWVRGLILGS